MNTRASTQSQVPRLRISLPLIIAGMLLTGTMAQAVDISAPDVVFQKNQTVLPGDGSTDLAISIDDVLVADAVTSVDLVITYDSDVAAPVLPVIIAGTVIDGWFTAANIVDNVGTPIDEIRISAASSTALGLISAASDLVIIQFTTKDASAPVSTAVTLVTAELNEAAVAVTPTDGSISLGANTGVLTLVPRTLPVAAGVFLDVTLTDADLVGPGPITVRVINTSTNEENDVDLLEDSGTPGLFIGSIQTAYDASGAGIPGNALIGVKATDSVTAEYDDAFNGAGQADVVFPTGGAIVFPVGIDGTVSTLETSVTPLQDVNVKVEDGDEAVSVVVTVRSLDALDNIKEEQLLTLNETATGVFENPIATVYGVTADPLTQTLEVEATDKIEVDYLDALTQTGNPTTFTSAQVAVAGANTGVLTLAPRTLPVAAGVFLDVTLTDADLVGPGPITVRVINTSTNEENDVDLLEDLPDNSGLFIGSIQTAYDASGAGIPGNTLIGVKATDSVTAEYDDALNGVGESNTVVFPIGGAIVFPVGIDGTVSTLETSVTPLQDVNVKVEDGDESGSVVVTVRSLDALDNIKEEQVLTLNETATGVFENPIATVYGVVADPLTQTLEVEATDKIEVDYFDALTQTGNPTTFTSAQVAVNGGNTALFTLAPRTLPVGAGVFLDLTLTDADLVGPGPITVRVINTSTNEENDVDLLEDLPDNSGLFIGSIQTAYNVAVPAFPATSSSASRRAIQ